MRICTDVNQDYVFTCSILVAAVLGSSKNSFMVQRIYRMQASKPYWQCC